MSEVIVRNVTGLEPAVSQVQGELYITELPSQLGRNHNFLNLRKDSMFKIETKSYLSRPYSSQ